MPMPQKLRSRIGLGMDYSPLNSKIRHLRSTVSTILSTNIFQFHKKTGGT